VQQCEQRHLDSPAASQPGAAFQHLDGGGDRGAGEGRLCHVLAGAPLDVPGRFSCQFPAQPAGEIPTSGDTLLGVSREQSGLSISHAAVPVVRLHQNGVERAQLHERQLVRHRQWDPQSVNDDFAYRGHGHG
jgi:hypothetical protein